MKTLKIALAGNPNSGKTTIFNALTGARQRVGNYAGVTVEKKEGRCQWQDWDIQVFDLPGIYSLTAYSLDEVVARDFLLEETPDVIVNVLDSTNLERNLYLTLQFMDLGIPLVGALNVADQAQRQGIEIDAGVLHQGLGIPLVKTSGAKAQGLEDLLAQAVQAFQAQARPPKIPFSAVVEAWLEPLEKTLQTLEPSRPRWLAVKLLEKDAGAWEKIAALPGAPGVKDLLNQAWASLEKTLGRDPEILISEERYGFLHGLCAQALRRRQTGPSTTQKVDAVVLNPILGLPIFFLVLWGIFQLTFTLGAFPQEWLEGFFAWSQNSLKTLIPPGLVQSLVVDGIIGGVGGVLSFVPLVVILFTFLSVLEDTGYMSRSAFLMDKFLHIFGLHGQSFLPMMLGFGCSVPAMMAARSLKSPRDRIITVLVIPFMNCGAKLPIHVLFAAVFFPENPGIMVMVIYLTGIFLAFGSAWIFRKTVLRGQDTPFVMELPPYRLPTLGKVLLHVGEKSWMYLRKAGTVILAASVLVWAATTFPQAPEGTPPDKAMETTLAGMTGKVLEPAFAPMGFDWKVAVATLTGFAAKEVVVSTLGVLYSVDGDATEENESLKQALKADPQFSPLTAFILMLFMLILAPCIAAQATIRSEIGGRWLGFFWVYSLALAWGLGVGIYQVGKLFGIGG